MKLVTLAVAGFLLAVVPGSASAQPVDCEAARCTVQASIDRECPCAEAKNHGRHTACVKRVVNQLVREGAVPKKCRTKINGCAIRSTCGKRDGSVACQLPGSAVTSRCRPLGSALACTSRGGTVVESCCESCAGPVPTVTPTEVPVPTATETATPEPVATETATPEPVATQTTVPEPTETPLPEPTATEPPPVATPTVTATQTAEPTATEAAPTVTAAEPTGTPVEPTGTPAEPTSTPGVPTSSAVAPTATTTEVAPTATASPVAPTPTQTAVPTVTAVPTTTATGTPVPTLTATPVPTLTATTTPVPTATSTPTGPMCGDGVVTGDEQCDINGPQCPNAGNGLEVCSMDCTCLCPAKITFSGDAFAPESILDTGWTGIAHRAPIISNGDVTVAVDCAATQRPCGTCPISGPIPNGLTGQHQNQRCTNDTSIQCANDSPCTLGGGTCEFFFGSNLPLAAGGVTTCVSNQFNGPVTGTANIETGDAVTNAFLTSRVYNGIAIDNPCPRCIGDGAINDGAAGGTCDAGPRAGLACDGNGTVANRPDFGTTSLDCPPNADAIIATLPIDLSSKTAEVVKELTAASPNCTGSGGEKCLCQTCNNANQEPCSSNADCPDPDGAGPASAICGGNRCLGGTNNGAPCTPATASICTGGGLCNRPGAAGQPSACLDDTATPNTLDCFDPDGDGEGQCGNGPVDNNCSVASGHAQRGCLTDADCGGAEGSCESNNRFCFLTGGGSFQPIVANLKVGSDSLIAAGAADTPVNDTSNPTLGAVFCVGPTGSGSVNSVAGLPGPGRVTIKGTARGLP